MYISGICSVFMLQLYQQIHLLLCIIQFQIWSAPVPSESIGVHKYWLY